MDPSIAEELRQLAAGAERYTPLELPDVENKLWGGQYSHPEWRDGNLPHFDPEGGVGPYKCELCGKRLNESDRDIPGVVWLAPHHTLKTMWEHHGIHMVCQETS